LFLAIPLLVWLDLTIARESAALRSVATGLAAVMAAGYSYALIRSGDTNSIAGAVSALLALVGMHAARVGWRGGGLAGLAGLTLAYNSHRGFFTYALMFLVLDAALARDWRSLARTAVAAVAAMVISLPRTWDLWMYPAYYVINNVELQPQPFDWLAFLRKVYYNVELLLQPGRWSNDPNGLATMYLPLLLFIAWRARRRPQFFALSAIGVLALIRLNYSAFGYAFIRPIYLLPIFLAPALAAFITEWSGSRRLAAALLVLLSLHVQIWWGPVPHVTTVAEFNPSLVDRMGRSAGALVLVENAFHRDVDVDPARESLPTPFDNHYEALLPGVTGRRFYAGMWDGWQWTPYRDQVFASGTFRGRTLVDVPPAALSHELRRWGVRHLFVWSEPAAQYLARHGEFRLAWSDGRWQEWEFMHADPRAVVTKAGSGSLEDLTPFGATVRLDAVRRGDLVVVVANYHPAWRAVDDEGRVVELRNVDGQLGLTAPADGAATIRLEYPRPACAMLLAIGGLLTASVLMLILQVRHSARPASAATP
jgi:hypothetical protein